MAEYTGYEVEWVGALRLTFNDKQTGKEITRDGVRALLCRFKDGARVDAEIVRARGNIEKGARGEIPLYDKWGKLAGFGENVEPF